MFSKKLKLTFKETKLFLHQHQVVSHKFLNDSKTVASSSSFQLPPFGSCTRTHQAELLFTFVGTSAENLKSPLNVSNFLPVSSFNHSGPAPESVQLKLKSNHDFPLEKKKQTLVFRPKKIYKLRKSGRLRPGYVIRLDRQ